jgi:hypothetical protein
MKNLKFFKNSLKSIEYKEFLISLMEEKIEKNEKFLENYLINQTYKKFIIEPFKSSKTAKNGLSLISKNEEKNLKDEKNIEIIEFFKLCKLLIINESEKEEFFFSMEDENFFIKIFFEKFIKEENSLSKIKDYKIIIFYNFFLIIFFRKFSIRKD